VPTKPRISADEYQTRLRAQRYQCPICGWIHREQPRCRLVVDHDHKTGAIRGLLCWKCNWELISFHRTPVYFRSQERLYRKAAQYMEKHYAPTHFPVTPFP